MTADTQIPVSEETRAMIREEKEKYGMTYDAYLRRVVGRVDPIRDQNP
jgi:hypothetical protein